MGFHSIEASLLPVQYPGMKLKYSNSGVPFWRLDFPCPWSQALALCRLAPHSLSYISFLGFGSYQHHGYQSGMCPQNLQTFACFCTINHTQSYKGRLFALWLSQAVTTGARTCYPQIGEPETTGIASYLML